MHLFWAVSEFYAMVRRFVFCYALQVMGFMPGVEENIDDQKCCCREGKLMEAAHTIKSLCRSF